MDQTINEIQILNGNLKYFATDVSFPHFFMVRNFTLTEMLGKEKFHLESQFVGFLPHLLYLCMLTVCTCV